MLIKLGVVEIKKMSIHFLHYKVIQGHSRLCGLLKEVI